MEKLYSELNRIQKELKAPKNQRNNFGNYNYRSCEDILEAVKPLLGETVLTLTDDIIEVGDRIYVKATATIENGDVRKSVSAMAREAENKKGMDDAQITGAASSYARKYALNGLFCIDDTKDADATNDHGKKTVTPKAASDVFNDEDKPWLDDGVFDLKVVPWLAKKEVSTAKEAMQELRKKYKVAKKWEPMIEAQLNK